MDERILPGILNYLCRAQLYRGLFETAKKSQEQSTQLEASVLKFYQGLSLLFEGRFAEAITVFETLKDDPIVGLASLLASIQAEKSSLSPDAETVSKLESQLRDQRKKAEDRALYYAAVFLNLSHRNEKAKEYADRLLKLNPNSKNGLAIKGWIELNSRTSDRINLSLQFFNSALALDPLDLDAIFGKINYYLSVGDYPEAMTVFSKIAVKYPNLWQLTAVKMSIYLTAKDWDPVKDSAQKLSAIDPNNILALIGEGLVALCNEGSTVDVVQILKRLYSLIEKFEPQNAELFCHVAKLFARVCGRHLPILSECLKMCEKAVQIEGNHPEHLIELGKQLLLHGRSQDALKTFKKALKTEESSFEASIGIIYCLIEESQFDKASQQLEVIEELHEDPPLKSDLLYLKAKLMRQNQSKKAEISKLLNEAYLKQMKTMENLFYGPDYLIQLNPDYLLSIAEEYLLLRPETFPEVLPQVQAVLHTVVEACPGLLPALYRSARVQLTAKDYRSANATLKKIVDHVDPTFTEAHLLLAQLELKQGNTPQAFQYLETGLSYNFQVRDHPLYYLLLAQIQYEHKEYEEGLKSLQQALVLSGMKPSSANDRRPRIELNDQDKSNIFLLKYRLLMALERKDEAGFAISEALKMFRGTPDEGLITLAQADYLLSEGEVEAALSLLKALPTTHPNFLEAREKMADVYLSRLHDERLYFKCYEDIVKLEPTAKNLILLGDAYVALHHPESAVRAYEEALKQGPRNAELTVKMGSALIQAHQYTKALNYYKDAFRDSNNKSLLYDYANLLMKLKQTEKAETLLKDSLLPPRNTAPQNTDRIILEVKLLMLMAKVQDKNSRSTSEVIATLKRALELQLVALDKSPEDAANLKEQKKTAATIASQIASYNLTERNLAAALRLYREALSYVPDDVQSMGHLAKLYLQTGDVEHCQYMCKSLLKIDTDNDNAMMMVAHIALRKNDHETAVTYFKQVLEKQPDNYEALHQYVEVCRRKGTLQDAENSVKRAKASSARGESDPGMAFCEGLLKWYTGQSSMALLALNKARKDSLWSQRAIRLMIDICLTEESLVMENVIDGDPAYQVQDAELMALHTAAKLLEELQPLPEDIMQTHVLLPNFYLLATRHKANVERALQDFTSLAGRDPSQEHPGAVLGIAMANTLLKQNQRAKNQLKRVAKAPWTLEEAEYLERCWLMLADIYIQAGKMDMASELLRRVLLYNRSSARAFEYLGFITEKEQSFRDASLHYESAWKLGNKTSPAVGYKLSLCYLKAKKYTDAIDVSEEVLKRFPEHPKIRKDVLDKAISNLRI